MMQITVPIFTDETRKILQGDLDKHFKFTNEKVELTSASLFYASRLQPIIEDGSTSIRSTSCYIFHLSALSRIFGNS